MSVALAADLNREITEHNQRFEQLRTEVGHVIVGQHYMMDRLLLALIADGHILLEGLPGLAKTTAVKAMADAVKTSFSHPKFVKKRQGTHKICKQYQLQDLDFRHCPPEIVRIIKINVEKWHLILKRFLRESLELLKQELYKANWVAEHYRQQLRKLSGGSSLSFEENGADSRNMKGWISVAALSNDQKIIKK